MRQFIETQKEKLLLTIVIKTINMFTIHYYSHIVDLKRR